MYIASLGSPWKAHFWRMKHMTEEEDREYSNFIVENFGAVPDKEQDDIPLHRRLR
jgi:hypothetical protein